MDSVISQIKSWDCDDIHDLRLLFRKLANGIAVCRMETPEMSRKFSDHIDTSTLPSIRFFEEIDMTKYAEYPVWAMDRRGYCLTGTAMDHVAHIVEIVELHKEKERVASHPPYSKRWMKITLRGRRRDVLSGD